jgi:preprotein translocase subunit SecB
MKTSLKFNTVFIPENDKEYILEFYLSLNNPNPSFHLNLKVCANFSTTEAMNDDFRKSPFLDINSPAIVFPYIRAFISNLTLNSGYNPIVLPMFNFVKIAEDKSKKSFKK